MDQNQNKTGVDQQPVFQLTDRDMKVIYSRAENCFSITIDIFRGGAVPKDSDMTLYMTNDQEALIVYSTSQGAVYQPPFGGGLYFSFDRGCDARSTVVWPKSYALLNYKLDFRKVSINNRPGTYAGANSIMTFSYAPTRPNPYMK